MTYLDERSAEACAPGRRGGFLRDLDVVLVATLAAVAAWAFWTSSGDGEITVHAGSDVRTVGIVSVAATAFAAAAGGALLLRRMVARLRRGRHWWTVVACGSLALSLLGPLGATNLSDGLSLLSLHTVVGAAVIIGLRRAYRGC